MQFTKRLGLFLALAFLVTACGSEESKQQVGKLPEQVVQLPEQEQTQQEAEQTDQEPQPPDDKKEAEQQPTTDPATPSKPANEAPASNGTSTPPATSTKTPSGGGATKPSTPPKKQPAGNFNMFVTHNFGAASVYNQAVDYYSGDTVMDVMRTRLEIETAYGGGFVNSINGVKSGYTDKSIFTRKKRDWFYYVNGSISGVGADAYNAKSGDTVWWDYHDWSGNGSTTPSVVGAYPHPFTVGYNGAMPGTIIYYSGGHTEQAERLAVSLRSKGAKNVRHEAFSNQSLTENTTNAILLGTWSELEANSSVQELFSTPTRTGIYANFENGAVNLLDYTGGASGQTGQALVAATGTGNGDTTPTWFLIGLDVPALDAAVGTLVNPGNKLRGKVGVVLSGGTAIGVPVAP